MQLCPGSYILAVLFIRNGINIWLPVLKIELFKQ